MSGSSFAQLPDDAWADPHMVRAWRTRDFRAVFHLACRHGLNPEGIAESARLPVDQVLSVMRGNETLDTAELAESVARGLEMPDDARKAAGVPRASTIPAVAVPVTLAPKPQPVRRADHPGIRINELRNELGWSQEFLAERAGVSVPTINKLERQERNPSLEMMRKIAGVLGVTVADIVDPLSLEKLGRTRERLPDYLPDELLGQPDFIAACRARDLGRIFSAAMESGFTVSHLARRCEMTAGQVTAYMRQGRQAQELAVFDRVSDGLHIPGDLLGMGPRTWEKSIENNSRDIALAIGREHPESMPFGSGSPFDPATIADRISELANWTETTDVADGTLSYLDSATFELAHDCLTIPPPQTGERADVLVKRISDILRTGHQRLAQTRDLYVIAGKLSAILSWISSDLGQLAAADAHARNGWTLAEQADHNGLRALLLSAQSKNEFLRRRYRDAAMHAKRGYGLNPPGTLRILLACQEADALQAMGRIEDAREALTLSEHMHDTTSQSDELGGIFGCGVARQANYSIATYLRAGSAGQALRHVERAEVAWRNGEEWAYGTWAQVQIGSAIAHLMNGEVEAAALTLQQILDQPQEQRLATLRARLHRDVTPLLANPTVGRSKFAVMIREGIADYDQSPIRPFTAGGNS